MEIEYIREFVILAETRNFAETADRLYSTQSTISKHLKSIEKELGSPLFTRTSRRVEINEFGQLFLPFARKMLQTQYEYKTALNNMIENNHNTVVIGSIPVMAQYKITDIIARFKRENKNITLKIIEAESSELKEMLRRGKCELAFIRDVSFEKDDEFTKIRYTDDTLVVVLPINHPLSQKESISLIELRNEDFLLLESNTMMYELCKYACQNAGFEPHVSYTGHRIENIIDLVRKGMGISLLMKKQALYQPDADIILIDIKPEISTHINLLYCKDILLTNVAKHFLNCVQIS